MKLSLVICKGSSVIEAAVLSWSKECWRTILPKRKPDKKKGNEFFWFIPVQRRRVFGIHANKMLEKFNENNLRNHAEEELFGFFALVGLGSRWVMDESVRWFLFLGERELVPGDTL